MICLMVLLPHVFAASAVPVLDKSHSFPQSESVLQKLLDGSEAGDTVILPPGNYPESILISKPITVVGTGVTLTGSGDSKGNSNAVVRVTADHAAVKGLNIDKLTGSEGSAVLVEASYVTLDGLNVTSSSYGIQVKKGNHNQLRNNSIGPTDELKKAETKQSFRRNGIDLFQSNDNLIEGNKVSTMFDGIYLESSNNNTVIGNFVDHSRYGIHCMYTNGTQILNNQGMYNVTGTMVMIVRDAVIAGNAFSKQTENVNSQGMLFFDVKNTRISHNQVVGNRVGLYIEESTENIWSSNDISYNFVGVQMLESSGNRIEGNRFVSNVIETQMSGSADNKLIRNYWDAFKGLDPDGDGISNMTYPMNPFFQRLTKERLPFSFFFNHLE